MSKASRRKLRPSPNTRSLSSYSAGSPLAMVRPAAGQAADVAAIDRAIRLELRRAAAVLGDDVGTPPYCWVRDRAAWQLDQIGLLVDRGALRLHQRIRTSADQPAAPCCPRPLRLGVFPVAADPLHWGHVLFSLQAMAVLGLDRVVFIVQGRDPTKRAGFGEAEEHRHHSARRTLDLLAPLVVYSDLGLGTAARGEDNVFRLLQLNAGQSIDAWYMAGGDHNRLTDPHGEPETLPRLEANMERRSFGYDWTRHRLRVLFARRRGLPPTTDGPEVPTFLSVCFLPEVLLASSTAVRRGALNLLPHTILEYLGEHPDYATSIGLRGPMPPQAPPRSA